MVLTLDEVKQYARIDIDDDDQLLEGLIAAAEEYLKNATGKEYPALDEDGNPIDYRLEKIYLQLLVAYLYEQRTPVLTRTSKFEPGEEFNYMTRALMLQLQNK